MRKKKTARRFAPAAAKSREETPGWGAPRPEESRQCRTNPGAAIPVARAIDFSAKSLTYAGRRGTTDKKHLVEPRTDISLT
jgi:hypothetical protein